MKLFLVLSAFLLYTRSVHSCSLQERNIQPDSTSFGKVLSNPSLSFDWDAIKYVYAFGDSYTFVQGTHGLANFSFIGDLQNISFTKDELLNDEIIFRNTSSDGANWIEFLTGCFSGKPIDCSPRQLWDFAFAGADIDGNLLPLHHPFTVPLVDQMKQWATYAASFLPRPKKDSLTVWWIGINDTGDSTGNETVHFDAFYAKEMDSLFEAVELAQSKGLTGTHLFLTVPPEERSPSGLYSSHAEEQKSNIITYNTQLHTRASQFAQRHQDEETVVLLFDAHEWFNFVLDNAEMFGFGDITGFCECSDSDFFWFNTGHPTEHTHHLLASAIDHFLSSIST
ncbi:uncharacterized protein FOMMEDRAFT_97508 [Fomitiporia mediterranea MF3/22]|uniref:uncharacterized protein n=1 Tax=Fomitiporia mediterranea (strain MF3/22) TaxID=694068 RepID=UPI00044077D1|nr:uncharacterized protein FOMMEDRAFT_97508 [Fomitiporia mediterranea MF3/22]EJC97812.1 hypothetical protein FOMMEDRAFT_97508 [Fomitiporia mediterranea MF3/22]